ncbi:MAG: hypothetical protein AAF825_04975 [Pseudomonadota bacterium]
MQPTPRHYVPSFITCADVTELGGSPRFVLCNEATGQYFRVNQVTVNLIELVNRTGSLIDAMRRLNVPQEVGETLAQAMERSGILVRRGATAEAERAAQPLEGPLISLRQDLFDAGPLTQRLGWFGRVLYGRVGLVIWGCMILFALVALLDNLDKARLMLGAPGAFDAQSSLMFLFVFLGMKAAHEIGHALAYKTFCDRAGLAPGPIRMGLAVFALTPFPFTDVTGAWRLRRRVERAIIGAGGLYVEGFAIALLTLFWAVSAPSALSLAVLQAAILSGGLALAFNLNPAVKLDGYYILTDLTGRANLAGRGSQAARTWLARVLGAEMAAPDRLDLLYWVGSYTYRVVLFAGIFWLAYRFDPGLAVPVALVTVMLLIVRPILASWSFLKRHTLRPGRVLAAGAALIGLGALCFVPLPDWHRMEGRLERFETRLIYAPEPARLSLQEAAPGAAIFDNPRLTQDATEAELRLASLTPAARRLVVSGAELAAVENDLARAQAFAARIQARQADMVIPFAADAVWTPLAARDYEGSWVMPDAALALGAVSQPAEPHLILWLPQARLRADTPVLEGDRLRVRLSHAPRCRFEAETARVAENAVDGAFRITAEIAPGQAACLADMPTGTAVAAALPLPPASLVERGWLALGRLLQDRLPVANLAQ